MDKATFLTQNEKRAAVGYGSVDGGDALSEKAGFRVDQPRVPAGQPGGGQWVGEGNGGILHPAQDNRSGYPIDLAEEELRGGHPISKHVGKSRASLLAAALQLQANFRAAGVDDRGADGHQIDIRVGSFSSLEAANKLVNSTIARNQARVQEVASGRVGGDIITGAFAAPTGSEAFAPTLRAQPSVRPTYGVTLVIRHDPSSPHGYTVVTAYPTND